MKLNARLGAAAAFIRAPVHLDIGADHALLPLYLLATGRTAKALVIEKHRGPFERSRQALRAHLQAGSAELRCGDGLEPLCPGEVSSLSLCGVGAELTVNILSRHPERLPEHLVLQPNDAPEPLRRWARGAGFHLADETMVSGFWNYTVLSLVRGDAGAAYGDLPLELALRFGPHLLRRRHPVLLAELRQQRSRARKLLQHCSSNTLKNKLALAEAALELST